MRLGGPVFYTGNDPEEYADLHVKKGYRAALCPGWLTLDKPEEISAMRKAMEHRDIKIAEMGAWCNPLHPDPSQAQRSVAYMIEKLRIADALEATTCVNIIGSKCADKWDAPSKEGYEPSFFQEAVNVVRFIVDTAKPVHTKLSFEMMPYYFLDSPEEYLRFLEAVDRKEVGIHLDICNCINQPRRYYQNADFIRHTVGLLNDAILSIHLKDIRLNPACTTVSLEEVLIGTGGLDYPVLLQEISKLHPDTPAILEHLATEAEYDMAAQAVREAAQKAGVMLS